MRQWRQEFGVDTIIQRSLKQKSSRRNSDGRICSILIEDLCDVEELMIVKAYFHELPFLTNVSMLAVVTISYLASLGCIMFTGLKKHLW
ncbi:hypothetical protein CICLE_v10003250mg [Citrus x clementina]|uniref:Uncharacterized protein n=1 Tax=Citrus clementina TaxID=85681 RepID=V4T6J5_CITCL|nr:hypothetical protein CICLE_v10003250mg [Citrus x clementina]